MDDAAMEAYLDGKEPDEATIIACLRKGTVSGKLVPVICGSAFKNKGVQPLLDAVVDFLPSPLEVPPTEGMMPGHREHGGARAQGHGSRCRASRSRS